MTDFLQVWYHSMGHLNPTRAVSAAHDFHTLVKNKFSSGIKATGPLWMSMLLHWIGRLNNIMAQCICVFILLALWLTCLSRCFKIFISEAPAACLSAPESTVIANAVILTLSFIPSPQSSPLCLYDMDILLTWLIQHIRFLKAAWNSRQQHLSHCCALFV